MSRTACCCGFSMIVVLGLGCTQPPTEPQETARLRVVNTSPDSPPIDGCFNDGASIFPSVGGQARGTTYADVSPGDHAIRFVADGADCTSAEIVGDMFSLSMDSDSTYLLFNVFDEIEGLLLEDDNSLPPSGMVRFRFIHADPAGQPVDIHVSDGSQLADDLQFKDVTEYVVMDAGDVILQIRSSAGDAIIKTFASFVAGDGQVITFYFLDVDNDNADSSLLITRDVE